MAKRFWVKRFNQLNMREKVQASQALRDLHLRHKISTFVGMTGWLAFLVALVICLTRCAVAPVYVYDMTWNCGTSSACERHMGQWSGSGQFSQEEDCLVWETAFINSYSGVSVTACTETQTN